MTPAQLAALADKYRSKFPVRCPLCLADPKVVAVLAALRTFHKLSVSALLEVAAKEYGKKFGKASMSNHFAGHPVVAEAPRRGV